MTKALICTRKRTLKDSDSSENGVLASTNGLLIIKKNHVTNNTNLNLNIILKA